MGVTREQLLAIMPFAKNRVDLFLPYLNAAMDEFKINTKARRAAFLATIGHESGQLRYVKELASGAAYEGRGDLGNRIRGDGVKYKGRGLIQITGRTNYTALMLALNLDCVERPELVETPENACRSAAWWFDTYGCNKIADTGDFLKVSIRVNGRNKTTGLPNGWADRKELYERALRVLGD